MTEKEFLAVLKKSPRKWFLMDNEALRITINHVEYCPLTYAIKKLTRKMFHVTDAVEGSLTIGIKRRQANKIVAAADFLSGINEAELKIREELFKACRIKKET